MSAVLAPANRGVLVARYRRGREATRAFFDRLEPSAYYARPIALRNPFVFYEGHLPAFAVNTILKRGLSRPGVDARLEVLFARGIDPEDESVARDAAEVWPSRAEVLRYAAAADRAVEDALENDELVRDDVPCLSGGEAVHTVLEHELMHQETLSYMAHRLPPGALRRSADYSKPERGGAPPRPREARIPAGLATLGAPREAIPFGWDNEHASLLVDVPAFTIDAYPVTNADYLEFVEAGGYRRGDLWSADAWAWRASSGLDAPLFWEADGHGGFLWRGLHERIPLPPAWPVWVSGAEAAAYARFRGRRLPTEAEYHRAAYGTPSGVERSFPWGEEPADETRGAFGGRSAEPLPVGARPRGASAFGVEELVGNGWEWTSTPFAPFPGFTAMPSYPEYSADFYDGKHGVLKGASPMTDAALVRRSLRNWFRTTYPYVYAKFRTVGA